MNETIAHIQTRRSIRNGYEDTVVPHDVLQEIINCGLAAPSSKNAQPWKFHVVTDKRVLTHIALEIERAKGIDNYVPHDPSTGKPRPEYKSTVVESAKVLRAVQTAVFVENEGPFSSGQQTLISSSNLAAALEGYGFEMIGIGAAIAYTLLAAKSVNVSSVFMGDVCVASESIKELLEINNDLCGVIALGYSALTPPPRREVKGHEHRQHIVWHGPEGKLS